MTPDRTPASDRNAKRLAWITAAAAAVILAIVAAIAFLPRETSTTTATTSAPESTTPTPTPTPSAAETLDAPGFDPNPGAFTLPDASGTPIEASFALADDATPWGGTVGFSFEATELANPAWNSDNSNLTVMLAGVEHPALRFGGNKVDRRMWWTTSDEPAPSWAEATVTPADLERVAAVAHEIDAEVTLVVDLGHDDPDRAADMVKHAYAAFGDSLLAITIGNEPNGYSPEAQPDLAVRGDDWDTDAYQDALEEYGDAIEAAAPGTTFAGPGAYDTTWMRAYVESSLPNKVAVTQHWYPLWRCDGPDSAPSNPTIEDMTAPTLRETTRKIIGQGAKVAAEANLPLWIEETGPTSCSGGNETSRTHAQALWTADYSLTAAETGAERIAFHSMLGACDGGAPMSPVCATGNVNDPGELIQGRTSYLALMQLSWIPAGHLLTPTVSGNGETTVHAVAGDDGSLTFVIVDLRDPADGGDAVPVEISAPTGLDGGSDAPTAWAPESGSTLSGASLDATASSLPAMAPVESKLAQLTLTADSPVTLSSAPGSTTVVTFDPVGGGHAAPDAPTASPSATAE
ncbi:hypothetical protein [Gulosibacter faecalis]|uniref:Uncharacterized protein n=1 Tax=Gulosibacter faecalis TaxID=272240 RepID=A0ABW5V3P7_9MICO|nr:hypothetical protein [Gulosibacter faecalis]